MHGMEGPFRTGRGRPAERKTWQSGERRFLQYKLACEELMQRPRRFLVTGAAGFIGSNLVETLLRLGQNVVALDNFLTGHRHNIDKAIRDSGSNSAHERLTFLEEDIRDPQACLDACEGVDVVLHQAALGSVPRSVADPQASHACNVDGFLNMINAARERGVGRFVYASSSSVYGDSQALPKTEDNIGRPLSPYALTKAIGEQYADVFARTYGVSAIGLRYFNVFGKRQDPDGPYAAVIPKWIGQLLAGERVGINGDGETSRDFCYIDNVVQMNILAATTSNEDALGKAYNVGAGGRTTLNDLYAAITKGLVSRGRLERAEEPIYRDFRQGDIRHSLADISRARTLLGYAPQFDLAGGLENCLDWYCEDLS